MNELNAIKTKEDFDIGELSPSCTPWTIEKGTHYHIERRDAGKYVLLRTHSRGKASFLLERDLNVLFEEEDVFLAMLMMDNRKDKFATKGV